MQKTIQPAPDSVCEIPPPERSRSVPVRAVGSMMLAAFLAISSAVAENADKRQYTLFNPTPRDLMREMSTDRPDLTEGPYTVDAGHFQIEVDAVNYSYDDGRGIRTESLSLGVVNLKAGLCNSTDVQLVLEPYTTVRIRDRDAGTSDRHRGFGDITTRLKVNVWGNDSGATALAVMPFVKFPSNQDNLGNNAVEGGLIVPFAAELPAGWSLGAMTEVDFMEDADGSGYHPEFINTIAFGHDIVGKLAGYVEFFSLVSTDRGARWVGLIGLGLTYRLSADIQLDGGVNLGVTQSADDINPFMGISWRF
ncbi:MAG: transporter [Verrucomicrobia bacterium]|nr:transporter [Verrucomicrobiota bacterium]